MELHIHLDGSLRMSTIWEISKDKVCNIFTSFLRMIFQGLALPGDGSLEALTAHVEMAAPANLTAFLSGFQVWLESISRAHFKKSIRISQINRSLTSVHSTSSYW